MVFLTLWFLYRLFPESQLGYIVGLDIVIKRCYWERRLRCAYNLSYILVFRFTQISYISFTLPLQSPQSIISSAPPLPLNRHHVPTTTITSTATLNVITTAYTTLETPSLSPQHTTFITTHTPLPNTITTTVHTTPTLYGTRYLE